ncbi:hypothetical protein BJ508DRAFT_378732 [Ascobolus immersus RN42]|uniref:Uncharacterized protein n=1 Tax=Ascobolus immersus RN42 TaxID=1160509 RepID=A0A3N4I0R1_ASCIM|nr:hypothetical protein BJ508DRAFT_378732 [Ascobolus immersus RN42]
MASSQALSLFFHLGSEQPSSPFVTFFGPSTGYRTLGLSGLPDHLQPLLHHLTQMGTGKQVDLDTRQKIKDLYFEQRLGYKKIGKQLNLAKSTVEGIIKHLKQNDMDIEPKWSQKKKKKQQAIEDSLASNQGLVRNQAHDEARRVHDGGGIDPFNDGGGGLYSSAPVDHMEGIENRAFTRADMDYAVSTAGSASSYMGFGSIAALADMPGYGDGGSSVHTSRRTSLNSNLFEQQNVCIGSQPPMSESLQATFGHHDYGVTLAPITSGQLTHSDYSGEYVYSAGLPTSSSYGDLRYPSVTATAGNRYSNQSQSNSHLELDANYASYPPMDAPAYASSLDHSARSTPFQEQQEAFGFYPQMSPYNNEYSQTPTTHAHQSRRSSYADTQRRAPYGSSINSYSNRSSLTPPGNGNHYQLAPAPVGPHQEPLPLPPMLNYRVSTELEPLASPSYWDSYNSRIDRLPEISPAGEQTSDRAYVDEAYVSRHRRVPSNSKYSPPHKSSTSGALRTTPPPLQAVSDPPGLDIKPLDFPTATSPPTPGITPIPPYERNHQLPTETRLEIKRLHTDHRFGIKRISKTLGIPKTTVQGILKHLRSTNGDVTPKAQLKNQTLSDGLRTEREKIVEVGKKLKEELDLNGGELKANEVLKRCNLAVHVQTCAKILREENLLPQRPKLPKLPSVLDGAASGLSNLEEYTDSPELSMLDANGKVKKRPGRPHKYTEEAKNALLELARENHRTGGKMKIGEMRERSGFGAGDDVARRILRDNGVSTRGIGLVAAPDESITVEESGKISAGQSRSPSPHPPPPRTSGEDVPSVRNWLLGPDMDHVNKRLQGCNYGNNNYDQGYSGSYKIDSPQTGSYKIDSPQTGSYKINSPQTGSYKMDSPFLAKPLSRLCISTRSTTNSPEQPPAPVAYSQSMDHPPTYGSASSSSMMPHSTSGPPYSCQYTPAFAPASYAPHKEDPWSHPNQDISSAYPMGFPSVQPTRLERRVSGYAGSDLSLEA